MRYREICKKLAIIISSTNVPNSIENLEFKDLLHTMDSRFVVPGRSVGPKGNRQSARVKSQDRIILFD